MAKSSLNILMIVLIAVTILFGAIFNSMFDYYVEKQMHEINKLNLKHFQTCYSNAKGKPLEKINTCLLGSLSSEPTGDAFVVNLKDMSVIWDNSTDCKTGKKIYLTKNSVCKISSNPESCLNLAKSLKKGYNGSGSWYFDDSKEIDDWIILPNETHNFDGTLRATNGLTKQYAIVQGNQYDEFTSNFIFIKYFVNIIVVLMLIIEILVSIFLRKISVCGSSKFCKFQE